MQYFQFDEYGNMYVYEPGSGLPGEAKLVEPGFEWSELSCSGETSVFDYECVAQCSDVKIKHKLEESQVVEDTPSNMYCL